MEIVIIGTAPEILAVTCIVRKVSLNPFNGDGPVHFRFKGCWAVLFHFNSNFNTLLCKQTVETPISDLGLHYLHIHVVKSELQFFFYISSPVKTWRYMHMAQLKTIIHCASQMQRGCQLHFLTSDFKITVCVHFI